MLESTENFFCGGFDGIPRISRYIACLSRKTHGFDKKDCGSGEAISRIILEKRRKGEKIWEEIRERAASARIYVSHAWEFMAANWGGEGGIGIAGRKRRWETKMERGAREGGRRDLLCATFRINSRIKWPAARHPYGGFDGTGSRRLTFVRLIN